jgi:KAP family P-loop domain
MAKPKSVGKNVERDPSDIDNDTPLQPGDALERDKLSRQDFAQIAAKAIRKAPSASGLVVSVEGVWGSGKTSVLSMIEALLVGDETASEPVIVHFNPWLVGEKDALLRHFLSKIANSVKLNDHSRDGKKVARELKAYAKVFDLVKLIPGAEPWASMIKSVIEATGDATDSIAEYKTPDIEAYKLRVEEALRDFARPIIVFIDDIDRLFPLEVFEMVRIIKAVGGLPHIGYIVAWDSEYVVGALEKLGVPFAASYLDKIVQVRTRVPSLSLVARRRLINDALGDLDPEVLRTRFPRQNERLSSLYHSGLRELLDQPRDVIRVFNALRMMEPLLRDEIVLADILGLSALSVKAPAIFELLRRKPRLFVGRLPDDVLISKKSKELVHDGISERQAAYDDSRSAGAAQRVVHFLFPEVANAEGGLALEEGSFVGGNVSHPARLAIALQLSVTGGDVSIKAARRYLEDPDWRESVVHQLTSENCDEFVELVGDVGRSMGKEVTSDLETLCLDLARLIERPLFVDRANSGKEFLRVQIEDAALGSIHQLVQTMNKSQLVKVSERIAVDAFALTCAAEIVRRSYSPDGRSNERMLLAEKGREHVLRAFSTNVLDAAKANRLLKASNAGFILWTMARVAPEVCPDLLSALKVSDPTLDSFASNYLSARWDSSKGWSYSLHDNVAHDEAYWPLEQIRAHAAERLKDPALQYPARAAWQAVVEGKRLYGDGSDAGT